MISLLLYCKISRFFEKHLKNTKHKAVSLNGFGYVLHRKTMCAFERAPCVSPMSILHPPVRNGKTYLSSCQPPKLLTQRVWKDPCHSWRRHGTDTACRPWCWWRWTCCWTGTRPWSARCAWRSLAWWRYSAAGRPSFHLERASRTRSPFPARSRPAPLGPGA